MSNADSEARQEYAPERPRVLALDLSLTAAGVAMPDGAVDTWAPKLGGTERLAWFRTGLNILLDDERPDVVAIEGYAFGRPNQATAIGELGGVVRLTLHDRGVPWMAVPPSNVKKYATGRGNAAKVEMVTSARERLGYSEHDDNQADALWLRALILDGYGYPTVTVPATHRGALAKLTFPELVEQTEAGVTR